MKRVKINAIFFIVIAIFLASVNKFGKPLTSQGFSCDDTSINKPYSPSTIPYFPLFLIGLALSTCCFLFGISRKCKLLHKVSDEGDIKKYVPYHVTILFVLFMYGTGITLFVTNVGKYSVGRLRPHFLSVCQPNWPALNCTDETGNKNIFYGSDVCQTDDIKRFTDSRLSFPSGHASFSAFVATFLVFFLETQVDYRNEEILLKYLSQIFLGILASCIGLSRITDYMHHPSDVIAGFIIGVVIGLAMHYSLEKLYYPMMGDSHAKRDKYSKEQIERKDDFRVKT